MVEIKKIKYKEEIEVSSQYHCTVSGKPPLYQVYDDCLNDCTAVGKPRWYASSKC